MGFHFFAHVVDGGFEHGEAVFAFVVFPEAPVRVVAVQHGEAVGFVFLIRVGGEAGGEKQNGKGELFGRHGLFLLGLGKKGFGFAELCFRLHQGFAAA